MRSWELKGLLYLSVPYLSDHSILTEDNTNKLLELSQG